MLPVTLTIGLINVSAVVDTLFASRLLDPELAPAAIDKAFRLYMLPQGMFSVAVTVVLFPTLSRLAARGDAPGLRRSLDGGIRQIAFLLIPSALVTIVLAEPIVRLVYQRGEFTSADTTVVAQCLQAFSIGLVFNGWMLILTRGFYAVQTNWLPTAVALGVVGLNAVFDALFYRLGIWGIPLATSVVNVVGTVTLVVLMRRRIGFASVRDTGRSIARISAASVLGAVAALFVWFVLDAWLGKGIAAQVVSVGAGLVAAAFAYLGSARVFGAEELNALLLLRARRPEPPE